MHFKLSLSLLFRSEEKRLCELGSFNSACVTRGQYFMTCFVGHHLILSVERLFTVEKPRLSCFIHMHRSILLQVIS